MRLNNKGTSNVLLLSLIGVIAIGLFVLGVVLNTAGKGVDTIGKMADQTVFNADRHVWTYEQFRKNNADFDQHMLTWKNFAKQVDAMEKKGQFGTQPCNNAVMARDGAYQMMARISADYNKMSAVAYQNVWKGSLPDRLDMPDLAELKQ